MRAGTRVKKNPQGGKDGRIWIRVVTACLSVSPPILPVDFGLANERRIRKIADMAAYAAELRRELCLRNLEFAKSNNLFHVLSYGEMPVVVYGPQPECTLNIPALAKTRLERGTRHGNFYGPSYAAIQKNPQSFRRLQKVHAQGRRSLPRGDRLWRELDSSTSSDALLMNIFCCPRVASRAAVSSMLGTERADMPQFGYRACVPLANGNSDRTEIDMKLGSLLVEAKLTEGDFQTAAKAMLDAYRDFAGVFDVAGLPRVGNRFVSYQLIRNVLAAHATGLSFCVMLDARRPDLLEAWQAVMRAIR